MTESGKKSIRLIELFAGYGSQMMALRNIGADVESWRMVEFDKHAVRSYNAVHGTDYQVTDIRDIHGSDLGIEETDRYTYLLTYSYPCFTADTLVLTDEGFKRIRDVAVGDKVMSHDSQYHSVIRSMKTGEKNIFEINGMCIDKIECTENHRFYVRKMFRENVYDRSDPYTYDKKYKKWRYKVVRKFESPEWVECKDLTKFHYLGVAINQNSKMPEWDGITFDWSDGRKSRKKNMISPLLNNHSFWWLIGRYVGDGWHRKQGGIIICCAKDELDEITVHLKDCRFNYTVADDRTVNKIHIPLLELESFVEPFGRGAKNKRIPGFMFDMPKDYIRSFLEGYLSADGYVTSRGIHNISSISEELIYGTGQLVAKAYSRPFSIYKTVRSKKCIIEGRICNQNDSYTVAWKLNKSKQDKAFYEDGYLWCPITSITNTETVKEVYDIEVEYAHSFTANGVIAHNCVDLSLAGKQAGMAKGSGTRSGLIWEVERLLNETENLPQILLMENVPQVHGKKNMGPFTQWMDFLSSKGYRSEWRDLNAADYGVPQSRKRCFMVSFLDGRSFEWPEKIPLGRKVSDILEDTVDERFYMAQDKADRLLADYRKKIERRCSVERLNTLRIDSADDDVAKTLMANYSKGYGAGFDTVNGVIERTVAAIRGRDPSNPSDRTAGNPNLEQRLEPNLTGKSNTLTTVQKDNMVVEDFYRSRPARFYEETSPALRSDRSGLKVTENHPCLGLNKGEVFGKETDTANTIMARDYKGYGNQAFNAVMERIVYDDYNSRVREDQTTMGTIGTTIGNSAPRNSYKLIEKADVTRIRRLTPKECFRLMGVSDRDADTMMSVNSNTQCYRQAGNSIVVPVLEAIFRQMGLKDTEPWS